MDQGLAAVLGAGVGVIGTLGTAFLTYVATRQQGRVEHGQWLREQRQRAYEDFLIAYDRFTGAAIALEDALKRGQTEVPQDLSASFRDSLETFISARSRVAVTGPAFASQSAGKVAALLREVSTSLEAWLDDLLSGADVSGRNAQLQELQQRVQYAYRDFVRDVRGILESPPATGGTSWQRTRSEDGYRNDHDSR
ncbi:hypothetical protein [Streptomyces sp. NPDC003480]